MSDTSGLCCKLVENLCFGVIILDYNKEDPTQSKFVYANKAANDEAGMDWQAILNKPLLESFPAIADLEDHNSLLNLYKETIDTNKSQQQDILYGDTKISRAWFRCHTVPLGNSKLAVLYENISKDKALEDALNSLSRINASLEKTMCHEQ